jgi:hypothetical protein
MAAGAMTGAVLLASSCKPNIEGRPSLIDTGRLLAVQSRPAEQVPDDSPTMQYRGLYASPTEGDDTVSRLGWAYCNIRKPIAIIGPAALQCLEPSGKGLEQVGQGEQITATLDKAACNVFGPAPPVNESGPASRAADPDITGGYYQPIRVLVPTDNEPDYVVGVTRISCGLAGANQDQTIDFATRYRPNENPAPSNVLLRHGDRSEDTVFSDDPDVSAAPATVRAGEHVTFRVSWATCPVESSCGDGICGAGEFAEDRNVGGVHISGCPDDCTTPKGCTGSEPYVVLDTVTRTIVDHREGMRVSWFATDGSFDHDRTGRTEEEARDGFSENDWVAPSAKGRVHMWFVLRDDRGGVGWAELTLDVGS